MTTAGGRRLISVDEITELTGAARPTVYRWHADRELNGHPDAIRHGRHLLFDRADWLAWHARFEEAKHARLTVVDRSGNPGELVTAPVAARILGYTNPATLRRLITLGYFVEPDATETLPSGRLRRYWRRRTLWRYADNRNTFGTNAGRPVGSATGPRKRHPYQGDPLLEAALRRLRGGEQLAGPAFAREASIGQRRAQRIIKAARALHADASG